MWLKLIFLVLLLAIAIRQSTVGLFSGLIMTVLSVCCAAGALGTYEWVAVHWLTPFWKPSYACAIALAACFCIPLIVLRVATDKLIRRSCLLPSLADRIGGGVCGLITAFVLVGVMAHAVQMVPFGPSIIGYSRVDVPSQQGSSSGERQTPPNLDAEQSELWLSPDRFAVGLASMASSGVFSGARLLTDDHPDLVTATGWLNAVDAEASRYAPPKSISVVRTERVYLLYHFRAADARNNIPNAIYEPKTPKPSHELWMVRVKLGRKARDENKSLVFTLRQFRLLGRVAGSDDNEQYFPIAIQQADATQTTNRHIQTKWTRWGDWPVVDDLYSPRDGNNSEVEIVFELPPRFTPTFVEYKKCARAAVSFGASADKPEERRTESTPQVPERVAEVEPPAAEEPAPQRRSSRRRRRPRGEDDASSGSRGGRVRGLTARPGQSFFGEDMPISLQAYQGLRNLEASRGAMANGHLVGYLDEQERGPNQQISKFAVPSDKRLLHLNTGRLHARSGLGEALSRAASVAQNYTVMDAQGREYLIIGKYAVANVENRQVIEVQYFPEQAGTIGGLGQFNKIKDRHLRGEYELVMLFLVDPGAEIASFSTGGSATRRDDLRDANLVAPR
ncbi:MAG: CvpA family protein [Planctomycetota bacterium]|jgi:hypothetical protein